MRPLVLAAALSVVAMGVACGPAGEGASVRSAVAGAKVDLGLSDAPRTAVLQFEARKPGTRPFPFPFVEVRVGSEVTRFVVDTGASGHSIDSALATRAGLAAPVHASSFSLDGWGALGDQPVAVVELPSEIRVHGIGGVLSTSLLAQSAPPGRAVVVDLVRSQLRAQPRSAAWASVEDLGLLLTSPKQGFCTGTSTTPLVMLDGTVDGEPTRLGVDTATSRSFLVETSKAGGRAAARPVLGRSISHSAMVEVPVTIHGGVPFTLGAWSSTADVGLGPAPLPGASPPCGQEGRLGMDVLQRCALAMTRDELVLGCRPPPSR